MIALPQVLPQPGDEARMRVGALLAEIGQLARPPRTGGHCPAVVTSSAISGSLGQALEHGEVDRLGRRGKLRSSVGRASRSPISTSQRIEARLGLAPEQVGERREAVLLDRVDLFLAEFERRRHACCPTACRRCRRVWCRPARPAICAISAGVSRRWRRPSNLDRAAKATWWTSRLRPMPMASVATM